jgi:hypothetical protein
VNIEHPSRTGWCAWHTACAAQVIVGEEVHLLNDRQQEQNHGNFKGE